MFKNLFQTWNPINNKKFETLSYLPPLSDESIAKEIDYMIKKGWIPCLEFDEVSNINYIILKISPYKLVLQSLVKLVLNFIS